jgi:hypothetical protein
MMNPIYLKRQYKRKIAVNFKDIPEDLYRQFKAKCAANGKTVKERIMELMENDVKNLEVKVEDQDKPAR